VLKQIKAPRSLLLDRRKLERALANAFQAEAERVRADLAATTETWSERPTFEIDAPSPYRRIITTRNPIWLMLNAGTKPHIIRPKNGKVLTWMGNAYRAKSRVRQLRSNVGGNNNTIVWAKEVQHPGTTAYEWTEAAAEKSRRQFPRQIQRAIDSEVGR
jgi:hypothetical protein